MADLRPDEIMTLAEVVEKKKTSLKEEKRRVMEELQRFVEGLMVWSKNEDEVERSSEMWRERVTEILKDYREREEKMKGELSEKDKKLKECKIREASLENMQKVMSEMEKEAKCLKKCLGEKEKEIEELKKNCSVRELEIRNEWREKVEGLQREMVKIKKDWSERDEEMCKQSRNIEALMRLEIINEWRKKEEAMTQLRIMERQTKKKEEEMERKLEVVKNMWGIKQQELDEEWSKKVDGFSKRLSETSELIDKSYERQGIEFWAKPPSLSLSDTSCDDTIPYDGELDDSSASINKETFLSSVVGLMRKRKIGDDSSVFDECDANKKKSGEACVARYKESIEACVANYKESGEACVAEDNMSGEVCGGSIINYISEDMELLDIGTTTNKYPINKNAGGECSVNIFDIITKPFNVQGTSQPINREEANTRMILEARPLVKEKRIRISHWKALS